MEGDCGGASVLEFSVGSRPGFSMVGGGPGSTSQSSRKSSLVQGCRLD